jgi:hypothetical protein
MKKAGHAPPIICDGALVCKRDATTSDWPVLHGKGIYGHGVAKFSANARASGVPARTFAKARVVALLVVPSRPRRRLS